MAKSISVRQKKRGRPATGQMPPITVRLPEDLIEAIDKWSRKNGVPTRSGAVRRLVEQALAAPGDDRSIPVRKLGVFK